MTYIIGSARSDENGNIKNGAAGDQGQKTSPDMKGEVSMQAFYVHKKGWVVARLKDEQFAILLAERMRTACNNPNIGYDQNQRNGVNKYGIDTAVKTECDCSSLVRQCICEATGIDPGNFRTVNEKAALEETNLFTIFNYQSGMKLYTGDVLFTKTSGHTVIVVNGDERGIYYPKYTGSSISIVTALKAIGETDTSYTHRAKIAAANGITSYKGTAVQNLKLLSLLKKGELVKA